MRIEIYENNREEEYLFAQRAGEGGDIQVIALPCSDTGCDLDEAVRALENSEVDIDSLAKRWVGDDDRGALYGDEAQRLYDRIREGYESGSVGMRQFEVEVDYNDGGPGVRKQQHHLDIPEPPAVVLTRSQYIDILAHLAQSNNGSALIADIEGAAFAERIRQNVISSAAPEGGGYDWEYGVRAAVVERDKKIGPLPGALKEALSELLGSIPYKDRVEVVMGSEHTFYSELSPYDREKFFFLYMDDDSFTSLVDPRLIGLSEDIRHGDASLGYAHATSQDVEVSLDDEAADARAAAGVSVPSNTKQTMKEGR
jgi:hypothetical protein